MFITTLGAHLKVNPQNLVFRFVNGAALLVRFFAFRRWPASTEEVMARGESEDANAIWMLHDAQIVSVLAAHIGEVTCHREISFSRVFFVRFGQIATSFDNSTRFSEWQKPTAVGKIDSMILKGQWKNVNENIVRMSAQTVITNEEDANHCPLHYFRFLW